MKNVKVPKVNPYQVWDRVKVSKDFFDHLLQHTVFQNEPKAINTAQYWLTAIDAAMERNDNEAVTWGWKDIQNRFQSYKQTYTVFRDALRDLGLMTFTIYRPPPNYAIQGECRKFEITPRGRELIAGGNYQWLYKLLEDPETRRRNQVAISKRKKNRTIYAEPMMRIIDEFRHAVKFECSGLLQQLEDDRVNCFGRWLSVSHLLLAFERKYFVDLEIKEGRIYHEFVALPSDYRRFAVFKGKRYAATLDIRACHPTFLGRAIWELFQQDQAAIEEKLNGAVDRVALERQASQWTKLFTDENADPRGVIMEESEIRLQMKDMKQCLNTWLNGAKKYRRKTDGRWDLKNNQRLEAWFQARFPEIARVWTVMEQRQITGRIIMEEYEYQLMLNPALYRLGDELALTLAYEYDGAGVFATPNDPDLPAKLDIVRSFIQEQSMRHFGVPVVVKGELIG